MRAPFCVITTESGQAGGGALPSGSTSWQGDSAVSNGAKHDSPGWMDLSLLHAAPMVRKYSVMLKVKRLQKPCAADELHDGSPHVGMSFPSQSRQLDC